MFRPRVPFIEVLSRLQLTSGLKLCLDAGDANSYGGSGQPWLDRSGNGYDFNRGTTSGAEASDPTFNGSAGALSSAEYWSFDGGDLFTYDSANETWMNNLHKDGAAFTFCGWHNIANNVGVTNGLFGTRSTSAGNTGVLNFIGPAADLQYVFRVQNAGTQVLNLATSWTGSLGQWTFHAVSHDESTGNGFIQIDGTANAVSGTNSSPSAGAASHTLQLGAAGNSFIPLSSGSLMAFCAFWEGVALTEAQVLAIYNASHSLVRNPSPFQHMMVS
jgi:hypothetical protein